MSSPASADIISLTARTRRPVDYRGVAASQLRSAREAAGLDRAGFAAHLGSMLGWDIDPDFIGPWEEGLAAPPSDVLVAARDLAGEEIPETAGVLLSAVPPAFPAADLEGYWLTCYDFPHAGVRRYHADVALITAGSGHSVRAVNHPPAPRTEGRAFPFRNQIEARLVSRHLTGEWRNTSDRRYFGTLHLAVLPGETIMEGWYSGYASDISVSGGRWKWARLDTRAAPPVSLHEPSALHALIAGRGQDDPPLAVADIGEEA